jgi:hypothetical protein
VRVNPLDACTIVCRRLSKEGDDGRLVFRDHGFI